MLKSFWILIFFLLLSPFSIFASQPLFDTWISYDSILGHIITADIDGDGDQDLVSSTGAVRMNNGDGIFSVSGTYPSDGNGLSVFAADLDGDGDLDLAVAKGSANTISILKNNGNGTFADGVEYSAGNIAASVFASDLDGDGDFDLAVANWGSSCQSCDGTISVFKNNGDGTFASKTDYAVGNSLNGKGALSIFAYDLDGDGDRDLATPNSRDNTVSVLKNNGDGTFALRVDYGTGNDPRALFISDLDGDGDGDLAVGNGGAVSVLKNKVIAQQNGLNLYYWAGAMDVSPVRGRMVVAAFGRKA